MRTLAERLRRRIEREGPLSLSDYMASALTEPQGGYYSAHDPLGREGDFTTAPEISQMFGELVGLWLADMWTNAGRPKQIDYVELGPGRGTLARDALRSMKKYGLEPEVHFVEASTALRAVQLQAVPTAKWHHDLSSVPQENPLLLVGNEFLDALPVRQLVRTADGWRERMIGLGEDDCFLPVAGGQAMDAAYEPDPRWRFKPRPAHRATIPVSVQTHGVPRAGELLGASLGPRLARGLSPKAVAVSVVRDGHELLAELDLARRWDVLVPEHDDLVGEEGLVDRREERVVDAATDLDADDLHADRRAQGSGVEGPAGRCRVHPHSSPDAGGPPAPPAARATSMPPVAVSSSAASIRASTAEATARSRVMPWERQLFFRLERASLPPDPVE